MHPGDPQLAGWRVRQHDPGRRRRRHDAGAQGRRVREGRRGPRADRGGPGGVARLPRAGPQDAGRGPVLGRGGQRDQGRHRGDHHRGAPALRHAPPAAAAVLRDQRQRLGDQVQVRQQVRRPALPDRRAQPGDRRADRRQGRGGLRLRRRRQGLRRVAARPGRPGDHHRGRSDLRAAGRDGRLPGRHAWRTCCPTPTSTSPRPAVGT